VTPEIHDQIMSRIILPTVAGMKARGTPFRGVLYAGVMLTPDGPKLFEYNVRFGDPECQVLMLRMMSDIVPAMLASCDGQLKNFDLRWFPDPALTVVMAAKGYPGDYDKGSVIRGSRRDAAKVRRRNLHARTKAATDGNSRLYGGRVLNVCASGKTVSEAQSRAYAAVDRIQWPEASAAATSAGRRWRRRRRKAGAFNLPSSP
jgi:phosphoribosylamine--glycine ligase